MIPGKLTIGPGGRVYGQQYHFEYNDPFPCVNGTPHATGAMQGVLMHTQVGNNPGTIASFNNPARQASANFAVAQDGAVHQFGPVGQGWMAWHAEAANLTWYGIEFADDGDPGNPLTLEQVEAGAQLVECLSAFAGFPLQVTDRPAGRGFGMHRMGGAAWGGHSCPQREDGTGPRAGQRQDIIDLAKAIRNGAYVTALKCPAGEWTPIPGTHAEVMPAGTAGISTVVLQVRTVA